MKQRDANRMFNEQRFSKKKHKKSVSARKCLSERHIQGGKRLDGIFLRITAKSF